VFGALSQVESTIDTVKEVNRLKARYVMERQLAGIKTEIAIREAEEIKEETVEKAKALKKERALRKHKALEAMEYLPR
jgi:hypothetical protein